MAQKCFGNDIVFAVKAPRGTTLEVPNPEVMGNKAAAGEELKYKILLKSAEGQIDVFLISNHYQDQQNAAADNAAGAAAGGAAAAARGGAAGGAAGQQAAATSQQQQQRQQQQRQQIPSMQRGKSSPMEVQVTGSLLSLPFYELLCLCCPIHDEKEGLQAEDLLPSNPSSQPNSTHLQTNCRFPHRHRRQRRETTPMVLLRGSSRCRREPTGTEEATASAQEAPRASSSRPRTSPWTAAPGSTAQTTPRSRTSGRTTLRA